MKTINVGPLPDKGREALGNIIRQAHANVLKQFAKDKKGFQSALLATINGRLWEQGSPSHYHASYISNIMTAKSFAPLADHLPAIITALGIEDSYAGMVEAEVKRLYQDPDKVANSDLVRVESPIQKSTVEYATVRQFLESLTAVERQQLIEHNPNEAVDRVRVALGWEVLPDRPDKTVPLILHTMGDVLKEAGFLTEAVIYFDRAASGFCTLLADSYLQLMQTYHALEYATKSSSAEAAADWKRRAVSIEHRLLTLQVSASLSPKSLADGLKAITELKFPREFHDLVHVISDAERRAFRRVAATYEDAIERFNEESEKTAERVRDSAHCHVNLGYCYWREGNLVKAQHPYETGLGLWADFCRSHEQESHQVAYVFKMLAILYRDQQEWGRANTCAALAVNLYRTHADGANSLDARKHRDKIRAASQGVQLPKESLSDENPITIDHAVTLYKSVFA